ncbi:serine--tRNA ligase [Candidatus Peregrinibacteria bacterium CG10_big_fil_rev_8_21_14_0_10_36_19]|nr:MAG: serine--tRNA ligase [Candidatus Peregrinibacteria bacterium CG10_big_fil_rev_8_21_14_0_10_36_19]
MLDIKFITENPEAIKAGAAKKNVQIDIDKILALNEDRKSTIQKIEELRARQNEVSKLIPQTENKAPLLEEMTKVKEEIKNLEPELEQIETQIDQLAAYVPNPPLASVPEGKGEEENQVVSTHGKKPEFDFEPKDHITLGKELDIIDIERGTRTSGARFYYLKGDAALLEFALLQHVIHKLTSKGFCPVIPPVLVKEEAMYATGFFPADRSEIYHVNPEEDDLYLVGTSEVPLTMLHASETIDLTPETPTRYCGFSPCFRREAGSYGKDTAGIIRVHQFDKIEMFSFCHPDKSEQEHELIRETEEEIMQDLGFHYQVLNICGGDLGAPAAKKYDIEVWIPTQGKFRELTSCSNCTDFQARRAKIKYKDSDGKLQYAHTLNGTAIAVARTLVAILENYQNADGTVTIPEVLRPYMGGRDRIK